MMVLDVDVDVDADVDVDVDGATVLELRQGILNKYISSFSYSFRTAFVYETAEPPNGRSIFKLLRNSYMRKTRVTKA